jgi:hypothetical protein
LIAVPLVLIAGGLASRSRDYSAAAHDGLAQNLKEKGK